MFLLHRFHYSTQQKKRGVPEAQTRTGIERYKFLLNRFPEGKPAALFFVTFNFGV